MPILTHEKRIALDEKKKNIRYTNVLYDTNSKQMINFTVIQFYVDKAGKFYEVVKHDFSHGCYNVHKYYLGHDSRREMSGDSSMDQLYRDAKRGINLNWQTYARNYCLRHLPAELKKD